MKTYTEERGYEKFDWNKALENPPYVGSSKHKKMCGKSSLWVTCAVGNQCAVIPRHASGRPKNYELADLALEFHELIKEGLFEIAKIKLQEIELLSSDLIEEHKKDL